MFAWPPVAAPPEVCAGRYDHVSAFRFDRSRAPSVAADLRQGPRRVRRGRQPRPGAAPRRRRARAAGRAGRPVRHRLRPAHRRHARQLHRARAHRADDQRLAARAAAALARRRHRHAARRQHASTRTRRSTGTASSCPPTWTACRASAFTGIAPGETYPYRFTSPPERHLLVSQPFRLPGAAGRLRSARDRAARAGAVPASTASTWCCCPTGPTRIRAHVFARLKKQSDYYNLRQRTRRRLRARRAARRPRRDARRTRAPGRAMRMNPTDLADVGGAHLHLPDERPAAGGELDRAVPPGRAGAAALHQRLGDDRTSTCASPA